MGLSTGLDSKGASSLLNMNIGMKKNESSNMNMTDGISGHSFDKMNSMFANNQSSKSCSKSKHQRRENSGQL